MFRTIQPAILTLLFLLFSAAVSFADVPLKINYQGRLTETDGTPVDGLIQINFKLYGSETGDDSLWWTGILTIPVDSGLINYQLGSNVSIPSDFFGPGSEPFLGITIGTDPELAPRTPITSSAFAWHANTSDTTAHAITVADNCVTASKISNNAVGNSELNSDAVTTDKIYDRTITNDDVSLTADILPSKISGTAMNLSSDQTITGTKTFVGDVKFGDSTMYIDSTGVRIGDIPLWWPTMLRLGRIYNSQSSMTGLQIYLQNLAENGPIYGIYCDVKNPDIGYGTGSRWGAKFYAGESTNQDGSSTGASGVARGGTYSYGFYGLAEEAGIFNSGIYGSCGISDANYVGYFFGNLYASGTNTKGGGGYKIDHPADPENMYLSHSDVSSPEMMNIYNGNVMLDDNGKAVVELPGYFESLNSDFRYQLTCIGGYSQIYIEEKINGNRFTIAGGKPFMEVSWMVTGIRKDAFADNMRKSVEEYKSEDERGLYMHPEVFGFGTEKSTNKIHHQNLQDHPIESEE